MEESSSPNNLTEHKANDNTLYWQTEQKLGTCMLHLYINNMWTDVTFRCQDHQEDDKADRIRAHKIVLAARSPFFQGMFFSQCSESKAEFDLLTTQSEILDLVLRYIYSDETTLEETTAPKVMELAHLCQISCLVEYCARFLITCLRPENACEILDLALLYNVNELRDAACVCIDDNAKQVLDSEGFLQISNTCLTYILKGDTFFEDETYIFNKAIEWAERQCTHKDLTINGKTIRSTLGEAFYYLRLPALKNLEFLKCVKGKGFYTVQEIENIIESINSKESDVVPCHRAVKREKRRLPVNVSPVSDSIREGNSRKDIRFKTLFTEEIECTIIAKVSRDCAIRGFSLQNVEPVLESYYEFKKDITAEIPLMCTFFVEDIKFGKTFHVNQHKRKSVDLSQSLLLKKRETPYTLRFKMKYSSERSSIRLEAICDPSFNNTGQGAVYTGAFSNKLASHTCINFHYSSNHINCIKSVWIDNFPNRKTEDVFVDSS
ncbi:BTB/POZ domain-containing protein 6-B-like [Mercenaria mercenaria]|uniref:BTB/POZ domain-containing protein 6-B-like n=1 Tax=Mercenaria mercenaria TaxID=6596 RepID=UPI00234FAB01|nr:BTB/POZ domain-containing protein 6-B-like [Mercenaria mercenaria]XP_045179856.2 BTB/POZ domain-containing protein 6-B-like [Mercenaria mercenaria]